MEKTRRAKNLMVIVLFSIFVASISVAFGNDEVFVRAIGGGLGDPNNDRVASMAIYNGHLYVGLNNEATGCEVWRTSIIGGQLGTDWIQVNEDGFGDADNTKIRTLKVFQNKLYAGTRNDNDGCQVWQTGGIGGPPFTDWTQVGGDGFGFPNNNTRVASMALYGGELYAGTANFNRGCQIWKSADGTTWTRVGTQGFGNFINAIASWMMNYNGFLFVGTRNNVSGVEMWRTSGAGGPPYTDWTQVNVDGFGDADNNHASSMAVFNAYLYVGTENQNQGAQVWRTQGADGPPFTDWAQVNVDGFGSPNNVGAMSMVVSNGKLYAGTWNSTGTGQLWRTTNGINWSQVPINGFTGNEIIATMIVGSPFYLGTGNPAGGEVWMQKELPKVVPVLSGGGVLALVMTIGVLAILSLRRKRRLPS